MISYPTLLPREVAYTNTTNCTGDPSTESCILQELQCYGLPYGGMGCLSHLLTIYTITMLVQNRTPFYPTRPIKHPIRSGILGTLSIVVTGTDAIYTMVKCHDSWEFSALASWQLALAVTLAGITLHAAWKTDRYGQYEALDDRSDDYLWWLVIYTPGFLAGFTGLLHLLVRGNWLTAADHRTAIILAAVFLGGWLLLCIIFIAIWTKRVWIFQEECLDRAPYKRTTKPWVWVMIFALAFCAMGPLVSDWVVASVTGNWIGVPNGLISQQVVYWTYFAFKRLPMFSY